MHEDNVLNGICCEVCSCVHNNGESCCTAKNITVKSKMAIMGEETACETYSENKA